jgi:Zn-dependent peptidase ImmA (M78 family)/transcriptional regulator with XRE-family HTH domain
MSNVLRFPDRTNGFVPRRLTEARVARQMPREELGRQVEKTGQAIGYYEAGERRPDMETLLRLAAVLDQPVSFFLRPLSGIGGATGVRFYRSVGPKSNKMNAAFDVKVKWLCEMLQFLQQHVRLPAVNLPPVGDLPSTGAYSLPQIEEVATQTRRRWGLGDGPIANMTALLETNGCVVTRLEMGAEGVDAFSCWVDGRPYILLGSDKGTCCRSRFDAAHELGHLILHRDTTQDDVESKRTRDRLEREAHWFAGAFLLPRGTLLTEFYSTRTSHLLGLKRRWRVSMQAIAHRCKEIGAIDEAQYILFRKQMSAQRWLKAEPLDGEIPAEQPGLLPKAWKMLMEKGIVREGGAEEQIGFSLDGIEQLCGPFRRPRAQGVAPTAGLPSV